MQNTQIDDYGKYFINCLKTGNINQAKEMLLKFKENLKKNPNTAYTFYCKDLLNSLIAYLNEIDYLQGDEKLRLNEAFLEFEKRFENIDQAVAWLTDYVEILAKSTSDDSAGRNKLVVKAIDMVKKNYMEDVCLSQICYQLHVSQPYFSKLFKDKAGMLSKNNNLLVNQ